MSTHRQRDPLALPGRLVSRALFQTSFLFLLSSPILRTESYIAAHGVVAVDIACSYRIIFLVDIKGAEYENQ